MATEEPAFDLFSPYFSGLVEDYDREAFPDGPPEDFDVQVGAAYNNFFKRPYVCTLMADVMSGRWKLGTSQESIAARLGGSRGVQLPGCGVCGHCGAPSPASWPTA